MDQKKLTARQRKFFVGWLGIPEEECPPDHYRMLGLPRFEPDKEKIRSAVQQRRVLVHSKAAQDDRADAVAIQKFLISVENVLIDPAKKQSYDERLEKQSGGTRTHAAKRETAAQPAASGSVATQARAAEKHPLAAKHPPAGDHAATTTTTSAHGRESDTRVDAQSTERVPHPHSQVADPNSATPQVSNDSADPESVAAVPASSSRGFSPLVVGLLVSNFMIMLMMGGLLLYLWKSGPSGGSAESVVASAPRSENAAPNSAVLANESHSRAVMLAEPVVTETNSVALERESTASRVEETSPGGEGDMVPVPESVLNGSAGSAESHKQESDAEEPITTLPFAELASAFDLPTIPTVSSEVSESSSAGKIAPHAVANLSLELDSSATNVSRFYEFRAKELTEGGSGLRTWQVLAVPAGNQAEDESQLGLFVIDELSQFRFLWQMNRPFPKKNAAQLANALLVLNSGDSTHTLQLRGVKRQERYRTQLFKKTLPIPLALENPPDEQKLVVRIQQLRGVEMTKTKAAGGTNNYGDRPSGSLHSRNDAPLQTKLNRLQSKDFDNQGADDGIELDDGRESESDVDGREDTEPGVAPAGEGVQPGRRRWELDIAVGEQKEMHVDDQERVKLSIQFLNDEKDAEPYKFGVFAKAETREGGNLVNVTVKALQTEILKQRNLSLKYVNQNIAAYNALADANAKLPAARTRLDALKRQALANPRSAPGLQGQIFQANKQVVNLQTIKEQSFSALTISNKNIPTSFKAFARKVAITRILSDIHSQGEIEFQLFAKANRGVLMLLAADGQPEAAPVEVIIPAFSLPGRWFRISNRTVYQLFDNGSLTITDTMGRAPNRRGTWRHRGDRVTFQVDGGREQYYLHEDVMMESATGSLYRFE